MQTGPWAWWIWKNRSGMRVGGEIIGKEEVKTEATSIALGEGRESYKEIDEMEK